MSCGAISRIKVAGPRKRTSTVFVVSPVTSSRPGMFLYSRGMTMPISELASLEIVIHNIVARTSEKSFANQLRVRNSFSIRIGEKLGVSRRSPTLEDFAHALFQGIRIQISFDLAVMRQ